jgi:hypothetical protein
MTGVAACSPPPLRGRAREGGQPLALKLSLSPHPNPPPQGGRESRCGTIAHA